MGALAARAGVEIHDFGLYDRALTHASLVAESDEVVQDYESLEFLGDAVLGLAISHRLFEVMPGRTPGEYSRLRASLVNRRIVAKVARELNLAPVIRLGRGEEMSGGRQRTALLADCMEAFIGAVYLDTGWPAAQGLVNRLFDATLNAIVHHDHVWDFKSRLQNYCQAQHRALPVFEVVRCEGPDHQREFEVAVWLQGGEAGRGRGQSKKAAEQEAAREALENEGYTFD